MISIYDPQSQWNGAWASHPLGVGVAGATIGKYGCFITSAAMILTHYLGRLVTPLEVDTIIDANRWYVAGDLWQDTTLPMLFSALGGGSMVMEGPWDFAKVPADLSKLYMDDTQERLIVLDFNHNVTAKGDPDGFQYHAVRAFSWDGKTLVIDDPWFGSRENFVTHYGQDLQHNILKIVGYKVPGFVPAWKRPSPPTVDPRDAQLATLKAQVADLSAKNQDLGSRLTQIHSLSGGN